MNDQIQFLIIAIGITLTIWLIIAGIRAIKILKTKNEKTIKAYDDYIEFLGKELSRHESMAVVRPYMAASGEVVAKGVELREKIEKIKNQ